jgi:3-methyl-2-oxobutanoate hydroxymethyltransferase
MDAMNANNGWIEQLGIMKARGEKIAVLTAYDYPTARLLDESGVDLLLVGDSLGMVVLGYPDTTSVTIEMMVHHTAAVARATTRPKIIADVPIGTYETPPAAVANAWRLVRAGAHAVKLEGGAARARQIAAIHASGIPVVAHIGMLPQMVQSEGGYRVKGRTEPEAQALLADAVAVEVAGALAIVLELMVPDVAARITRAARIPTIGIGAGAECDGQVLVTHDLIGFFPWFTPKFATVRAQISDEIRRAASEFVAAVKGAAARP